MCVHVRICVLNELIVLALVRYLWYLLNFTLNFEMTI